MSKYSIVVVGCGATGSNFTSLVSQLAISEKKIREIILIDGDEVERKNFRNQRFTERNVGMNKSRVLAARYSKLGIDVSYIERFIESTEDLLEILINCKDNLILVGCVDNNNARKYMHEAFHSDKIPTLIYVDTGNGEGENRNGQTVCGLKQQGRIITPAVGDIYPQALIEEEIEEVVSFKCSQIEKHPQNFATNVLSATSTFLMVNNIICLGRVGSTFIRFDSDKISIKGRV